MKSICLITCYMGPLPGYFAYYTATCKKNKTIDFMVINDHIAESYTDGNISFVKMNIAELNTFSGEQLKAPIQLSSAWKINELKPLFGEIFSKELSRYDHWGWCDLDIIWGDLRKFLNDELLNEYDVITTKEYWTAGHFTLFKNKPFLNALYKRYDGIIALLNNPTYFAFEECCHRWNGEIFTFEELKKKGLPPGMFDIVKQAEQNGELKAHFKDIIREHPQPVNYIYKNGALTDLANHEEFMYYHLITVKKIWRFYIPEYKTIPDSLIMSQYGIRGTNDQKPVWFTKRLYACYKGIRKSAKKQKTAELIKKLFR